MFLSRQRWKLVLCMLMLVIVSGVPVMPTRAQTQVLTYFYFPQTGHYLGGAFRSYWERNGGVTIFGYPITEEYIRSSDGKLVQYFERARFELRVENNQAVIDLGLLGTEYIRLRGDIFQRVAPFASTASARYFAETGHSVRGLFKAFWDTNNGMRLFGYPISEEGVERFPDGTQRTVQYFERARFELHDNRVLLGLLGDVLAPCQLRPPLPPNAPPTGPVPEGDGRRCPPAIPVAFGRAFPEVSRPGTVLGFEARGYRPGETISMWLNLPDGSVREVPYTTTADADGGILVGFRTQATDIDGQWSIVGRGVSSNRQVVAIFFLRR